MSPLVTTRALLKSLISGPLLVGDLPEARTFPFQELSLPDEIPSLNLQQKLGHLYEDALAILIEKSPRWDLLERNLQIQTDIHTTLGELDFLLRDTNSGQLIHLELATKFYLGFETGAGFLLPGPDARDNYQNKLSRLRNHQLRLPDTHQALLPGEYRDELIITRHLVYGCLFDHVDATAPVTPEFINPHCRRGKWLTLGEVPSYFPADTCFSIIPKPLWPVPVPILRDLSLATWQAESAIDRCLMVRPENSPHPFFITPDSYPAPP